MWVFKDLLSQVCTACALKVPLAKISSVDEKADFGASACMLRGKIMGKPLSPLSSTHSLHCLISAGPLARDKSFIKIIQEGPGGMA